MGTELPEVQELFDQIAQCLANSVEFSGPVFRSAGVKYANEDDFLSGEGAAHNGGRWNPRKIKAIYASVNPVTATRESYQQFAKFGFKDEFIKPRVMAGANVELNRLLDLTDRKIRSKIGFRLDELLREDWHSIQLAGEESWTQAIGRGAHNLGFEGLIAPSAQDRPDGKNIIIFPEKLEKDSKVTLIAKNELPPHPSKWVK